MKRERITIEEIYLKTRTHAMTNLSEVEVIVLEITGDIMLLLNLEKVEPVVKRSKMFSDIRMIPD
jgi:uncharacterized membrane protein YcaP (DUF421 family)